MKTKLNIDVSIRKNDILNKKYLVNDYKCIEMLKNKNLIPNKYYNNIISNNFIKNSVIQKRNVK